MQGFVICELQGPSAVAKSLLYLCIIYGILCVHLFYFVYMRDELGIAIQGKIVIDVLVASNGNCTESPRYVHTISMPCYHI